eukprot:4487248-Amphidinium_carterae.1
MPTHTRAAAQSCEVVQRHALENMAYSPGRRRTKIVRTQQSIPRLLGVADVQRRLITLPRVAVAAL